MTHEQIVSRLRKSELPYAAMICVMYDLTGRIAPHYLPHAARLAVEDELAEKAARASRKRGLYVIRP